MSGCATPANDARPIILPSVRDVVLVASGKGGVGKSTITVNLAASLSERGLRVGVLDADVTGPSVALLLGSGEGIDLDEDGRAQPAVTHGMPSISVGNLLPPEAALTWKGPLIAQAVEQLFTEVAWPDLDVLLVDLPPGTGDVHLTILERVAVSGAVIVTTPQRLATVDAERGIAMFHELDIPVFGIVENMTGYVCPCCGEIQALFPGGGATSLAARRHVAHLGAVPVDPAAQAAADAGTPLVLVSPGSPAASALRTVAERVIEALDRERAARRRAGAAGPDASFDDFWKGLTEP